MQIQVTRNHIRRGRPIDPEGCMIALAIADAVPLARNVIVGVYEVTLFGFNTCRSHITRLPAHAEKNRHRFDVATFFFLPRWLFIRPFAFELEIPSDFLPKEPQRRTALAEEKERTALTRKD